MGVHGYTSQYTRNDRCSIIYSRYAKKVIALCIKLLPSNETAVNTDRLTL
jgi:hypothetical protein